MMILVKINVFENLFEIFHFLGDANGLDEPEFFRKMQPSLHFNDQNSNMDFDSINKLFPILLIIHFK
jgi:hypothetical protein